MSKYIKFFSGFICGALVVALLVSTDFFVLGIMGAYKDKQIIDNALANIYQLKNDTILKIEQGEKIERRAINLADQKEIESIYQLPEGDLILKINTSKGHIIWLSPLIDENNQVIWECKGAPNKDIPPQCI